MMSDELFELRPCMTCGGWYKLFPAGKDPNPNWMNWRKCDCGNTRKR